MSARIRQSSLRLRKYDWIFCESIDPQRRRALHIHTVAIEGTPAQPEPKPGSRRRLQKFRISRSSTGPVLSAESIRIVRVATEKPLIRRLEVGISTAAGSSAGDDRTLEVAADLGTPTKPLTKKRSRGLRVSKIPSNSGAAAKRLPNNESRNFRISRVSKRELEPINQQSQTVRFLKHPAEPATPVKPSTKEPWRDLRKAGTPTSIASQIARFSKALVEPVTPIKPLNRKNLREALQRKIVEERKRQLEMRSHGFRKVSTEKHPVFRKVAIETSASIRYVQQHIFRSMERPVVREVDPLKITTHWSISLKDRPFLKTEAQKVAEEAIDSRPRELRVLRFPEIIKYGSVRLRKHIAKRPKFAESAIGPRNRSFKQQIIIRRPKSLFVQKVQTGLILPVQRPENLVIQRVPTSPKELLEPSVTVEQPPLLRPYPSSSLYSIPTEDMKGLFEASPKPTCDPIEQHPPTADDESPTERIERAVEYSSAKRIQRESWLARNGDMRLAISLLFSPSSLANVERLRKKYSPDHERFGNFRVLRRLEIGKYREYDGMLTKFVESWKPFNIKLNEPGHFKEKLRYRVGFQLEFERLQQLERELLEATKNLPGRTRVNRRNTRDNDELGMMVINGKIKEAEEAIRLMEQLELEHEEGLGNVRVEGLVLHGYAKGGDCLFPPPKEFLFPGAERTDLKSEPLVP